MTVQDPIAGSQAKPAMRDFLSLPTWIHAGRNESGGSLSLVEQIIPPGFTSPWHVHHDEDESFFVMAGEITVYASGRARIVGAGQFAFGPRALPYGFRVTGAEPARLLLITTGSGFADFVQDASDPIADGVAIEPHEPDIARVIAAAERHGLAILGPIPDLAAA
ncbi:cupin domain-containing protein [Kaistia defluvii]|uniref:cupin domain-containing protein n=1 Tax=Kaistia defluvii TaxID=410841 RepID=UPI0022562F55|nr:cupin domain-containing protein [Kaistia defluvii]MCX5518664.1 cupin domain-containing protein [Kaistia defluvii]